MMDLLARLAFVCVFAVENVVHLCNFETEVESLVSPAWVFLPRSFATGVHAVHVTLGLLGPLLVLLSASERVGTGPLHCGASMMQAFLLSMTWTWWINRHGTPYWKLDDPRPFWDALVTDEKKNRSIHIMKNLSTLGALAVLKRAVQYEAEDSPVAAHAASFFRSALALGPLLWCVPLTQLLLVLATSLRLTGTSEPALSTTGALGVSLVAACASLAWAATCPPSWQNDDGRPLARGGHLILSALSLVTWGTVWYNQLLVAGPASLCPIIPMAIFLCVALDNRLTSAPPRWKFCFSDALVFGLAGPATAAYCSKVLFGEVRTESVAFSLPVALGTVAAWWQLRGWVPRDRGEAFPASGDVYYCGLLTASHLGFLALSWAYRSPGLMASLVVVPQSVWLCRKTCSKSAAALSVSSARSAACETVVWAFTMGLAACFGLLLISELEQTVLRMLGITSAVLFVFALCAA